MDLPFVPGYKPRGNAQLLLRKAVHKFVLDHSGLIGQVIDALEETAAPAEKMFRAVVVAPPAIETVARLGPALPRMRLPRHIDFAAKDEVNRKLGRAGEQWAISFEQQRLEWVSDQSGDGAGYDILSYDAVSQPRYIEVKTTNGAHAAPFIISRNELEFSQEAAGAFFLYRVFQFRQKPALYMLRGDVSQQLHPEPIDYRASFRRVLS
jgi:hypothetical protein